MGYPSVGEMASNLRNALSKDPSGFSLLLMAEILHHLGCMNPYKEWDKLPTNWCRISAINSSKVEPHKYIKFLLCPRKKQPYVNVVDRDFSSGKLASPWM